MGKNYYAVKVEPCLHNRVIHLGKDSFARLFMFADNDEIHTFPQFCRWLENYVDTGKYLIFDETDKLVSKDFLLDLIERKQNDERCKSNPDNFKYNCRDIDGYRFCYDKEFC